MTVHWMLGCQKVGVDIRVEFSSYVPPIKLPGRWLSLAIFQSVTQPSRTGLGNLHFIDAYSQFFLTRRRV